MTKDDDKGGINIDISELVDLVRSNVGNLKSLKQNNSIKTTVEVEGKGLSKTSKEIQNVGSAAKKTTGNVKELTDAYSKLLNAMSNVKGMTPERLSGFEKSLGRVKSLIDSVTNGMERVDASGGKNSIVPMSYTMNAVKSKTAQISTKQHKEWEKKANSAVRGVGLDDAAIEDINNTAQEIGKLVEFYNRQKALLSGLNVGKATEFDVRAYADDRKEMYRLGKMMMERSDHIKRVTGKDIFSEDEKRKYFADLYTTDKNGNRHLMNENEFLESVSKALQNMLLSFSNWKKDENGNYHPNSATRREKDFGRILEKYDETSFKYASTLQRKINARRNPPKLAEGEATQAVSKKDVKKNKFDKYLGFEYKDRDKVLKKLQAAYESDSADAQERLIGYVKALKEMGVTIDSEIEQYATELVEGIPSEKILPNPKFVNYKKELDAAFEEYKNNNSKKEATTPQLEPGRSSIPETKKEMEETGQAVEQMGDSIKKGSQKGAQALGNLEEKAKETGAATQKMGEQIKDGAEKGAAALDDLKGKAEETGKAIKEANDKAAEAGNTPIKIEEKNGSESTPMTRDQLKKRLEKDQEKEQKEPEPERVPQSGENTKTLAEKLKLLQDIKKEYKFLDGAEDKRIDMEEKAWDVGGNNPKSEAESNRKITAYEDHIAHMDRAEETLDNFESTYEKLIITLKDGQKIEITDFIDLEDLSLAKKNISDIQLILAKNESSNEPTAQEKDKYTFAADIKQIEGYKDANNDFVNQLIANVVSGKTEYDKAMEDLKSHISQRQEEIRQEQEKNLRVNTEIGKFGEGTKPILEAMGLTDESPRPQAYADMIAEIQSESIKGEEAVTKFAEAVGYTYDEVNKKWAKINNPKPNNNKKHPNLYVEQTEITASGAIESPNGLSMPTVSTPSIGQQAEETAAAVSEVAVAEENVGQSAQEAAELSIQAMKQMKDEAQQAYDSVKKVLEISYINSGGRKGQMSLNLEEWFGANNKLHELLKGLKILSETLRMAQNYDEAIQVLHDFMYARLRLLESDKMWLEPEKIKGDKKIQNQITKEQNRYYKGSSALSEYVYGFEEITPESIQDTFKPTSVLPEDTGASSQLENLKAQLEEIKAKATETVAAIGSVYATPISSDQNEDYYKKLYADVENLGQVAADLRGRLSGIQDPSFLPEIDAINKQLDFIEQNVASQKGRIQSVYDSIDFNAREAERLANQRTWEIAAKITGNSDFSEYGDQSWLQKYIDRARTETTELDSIYADFEKQLAERKAAILLQQQKDDALVENQDKFKSFIRGISPTGEDEYNLNMNKYRDIFNGITDEANTLDDAINKVKTDLAQMEVDKFNSAKDGILSQYGKAEKDIPSDQWKTFLDGLANGSLTAVTALKQLQDALEKMKNTTPPPSNNPPSGNGGQGNNPSSGDSGNNPHGKHKIIKHEEGKDGSWRDTYYEEPGRTWVEGVRINKKTGEKIPYTTDTIDFSKLEKEAIKVGEELIVRRNQLAIAQQKSADSRITDKIQDRIALLEAKDKELKDQADEYDRRTLGKTPYTRKLFDERVKAALDDKKTKEDIKQAEAFVDLEIKKQNAIDNTNAFIEEQGQIVENVRNLKVLSRNDIPADTLQDLEDRYANINTMLSNAKNSEDLSEVFKTQLTNMISEYKNEIAKMERQAQIALKLSGRNPDEARAIITKDMNSLLEDMQRSTADGITGKDGLQDKLQALMSSFEESTDNSSGYLKSVNQQVNILRSNFQQAENSMKFAEAIEKDVAKYEKAVEHVGEIQAKLNFEGEKGNKNQLVLQLEEAERQANKCFTQVERVKDAINTTGTDKWRQDLTKRIGKADEKYKNKENTDAYKDAKLAYDKKQLSDAITVLEKYEAAVRKVVDAQAALDFGDEAKKPALKADLEAATNEAKKLKTELDKLSEVYTTSPLLSDEEKSNYNDRKIKAEGTQNDPKQSPYYESAKNVADEKTDAQANKAKEESIKNITKAYQEMMRAEVDALKNVDNDLFAAKRNIANAAKEQYADTVHENWNYSLDKKENIKNAMQDSDVLEQQDSVNSVFANQAINIFNSKKEKLYQQYQSLITQLKDTNKLLQPEVDEIKNTLDELFHMDDDGIYSESKNWKGIDDIEKSFEKIRNLSLLLSKGGIQSLLTRNKIFNFGDILKKEDLEGMSTEYIGTFNNIRDAYSKTIATLNEKAETGPLTDEDWQRAAKEMDRYSKSLKDLLKTREANKLDGKNGRYVEGLSGKLDKSDLGKTKDTIKQWVESNGGRIQGDIEGKVGGNTFKFDRINELDGSVQSVVLKLNSATGAVHEFVGEAQKVSTVSNVFKGLAGGIAQYASMMFSTYRIMSQFTSQFKQGFATLTEYDKALTTISYTMDVSKEQLNEMGQAAVDMANDLKMSLSDTLSIYQIYANMNTSPEEIRETAMPTAILANLSGVDASTAADQIQGVIQQFQLLEDAETSAADVSMHIADVFDKISSNISMDYARGIKSMADAVQKTGAEAMNAGLSFEQLSALVAKVAERTRAEGSEIGGAIRTILVRLSKVGKMPGYEDEVSNEELSNASKSLHAIGVEVYDAQGNFREFDTIIEELANKWDSLSDAQKSNISYNIAATRQSEKLKNILIAYKDAMKLAEEATNANGNALANQEKYEESLAGQLQGIKTEWQTFWMDVADSSLVHGALDIFGQFTKAATGFKDAIPGGGIIAALLYGTAGLTASSMIPKALAGIVKFANSSDNIFQAIAGSSLVTDIKNIGVSFSVIGNSAAASADGVMTLGSALTTFATNHIGLTIAAIATLTSVFIGLVKVLNSKINGPSLSSVQKEASDSTAKYEEQKQKVQELNTELETTQSRINEINSQENISITDEAELTNLQKTNEYLQNRIKLEESLLKMQEKTTFSKAYEAASHKDNDVYLFDEETGAPDWGEGDRLDQALAQLYSAEIWQDQLDGLDKQIDEYTRNPKKLKVPLFSSYENEMEKLYEQRDELDQQINDAQTLAGTLIDDVYNDFSLALDERGNYKGENKAGQAYADKLKHATDVYNHAVEGESFTQAEFDTIFNEDNNVFSNYTTQLAKAAKESEDAVREIVDEMISSNEDEFSKLAEFGITPENGLADIVTQYFMNKYNPKDNTKFMKNFISDSLLEPFKNAGDMIVSQEKEPVAEFINSLSGDQIKTLFDTINSQEIDTSGWGIEEAKAYLKSLEETEIDPESSFLKIFSAESDEGVAKQIDDFQSHADTIRNALNSLKTGEFKENDIVDLVQSIPDFTSESNNLEEALSKYALTDLSATISKIREVANRESNGLTDLQKEYMERVIQGLTQDVDLSGLDFSNLDDIRTTILDNLIPEDASIFSRTTADISNIVGRLTSEYSGDEAALHAIVALSADTTMANATYEEWKNAIEQNKILAQISIDEQTIKGIDNDITNLNNDIKKQQDKNDYKVALGVDLDESDYQELIGKTEEVIDKNKDKIGIKTAEMLGLQASDDLFGTNNSDKIQALREEIAGLDSEISSSQLQILEWVAAINEIPTNKLETLQDKNTARESAEKARQELRLGTEGGYLRDSDYDMLDYYSEQSISYYDSLLKEYNEDLEHLHEEDATAYAEKQKQIAETEAAKYQAELERYNQQYEARRAAYNIPQLQDDNTDLQSQQAYYENQISLLEAKNEKVSTDYYKDLVSNGKDQIKNLKTQRNALRMLQNEYKGNATKVRELQSEIDNVDSSISSMESSIAGWQDSVNNLIVSNAQALSSAISTALSEMNSETGIAYETMQDLSKQFGDLENHDISALFYRTAEGVKVDTDRLKEYAQQENDIIANDFANRIKEINDAMRNEIPGSPAMQEYQKQLETILDEQARYYAEYQRQIAQLSKFNAIDIAESTENQGAHYDKSHDRLKTYKEASDNGLTGTDEFQAYTAYLDEWGRTTDEAFTKVYTKASRYLTEDATDGLDALLTDMQALGLAAQDATGTWTLHFENSEEAAHKLGIGVELLTDSLGKMEEYGFDVINVRDLTDASLKAQDMSQELYEAKKTLHEMEKGGASAEAIADQQAVVDNIINNQKTLSTLTNEYVKKTEQERKDQFKGLEEEFSWLQDQYKEALNNNDDETARKWLDDAQTLFDQYGLKLEITPEGIEWDSASYERYKNAMKNVGSWESPLSAQQVGFSEEDIFNNKQDVGAWMDVTNKLQAAHAENNAVVEDSLSTLKNYTAEQLKSINLSDGQYDNTFKGAKEAEQALDTLASTLGLSAHDAQFLAQALLGVGQTADDIDFNINGFESFNEQAKQGVKELKEMHENGDISIDIEADTSNFSEQEIEDRISYLNGLKLKLDPEVDSAKIAAIEAMIEQLNTQSKINLVVETSGKDSLEEFLGLSEEEQREIIIESKVVGEDEVDSFLEKIKGAGEGETVKMTVTLDETQFAQLTSQDITVNSEQVDSAIEKVNTLNDTNLSEKTQSVDTGQIDNAKRKLTSLNGMKLNDKSVTVTANTSTAQTALNNIATSITKIRDKSVTITVNRVTHGSGGTIGETPQFTGTLLSPAKASGTAYNVKNYIPLNSAKANGDVAVDRDQESLVNELGTESIIRNGQWFLIPGGMRTFDLKKGDIVLNHLQTKSLIEEGKAPGRGKLYSSAWATGTMYNGMPAYSDPTTAKGKFKKKKTKTPKTKTPKTSGGSGGDSGGKGNGNNNTGSLDNFKKWLEKLFDWIEVRLDRVQYRIDLNAAKMENAVGYLSKNSFVEDSIKIIGNRANADKLSYSNVVGDDGVVHKIATKYTGDNTGLIADNARGAVRYQQQANKVYNQAVKNGLVSKEKGKDLIKLIQTGAIDVSEYDDKTKEFINDYKEWYDKSQQAIANIEDLKTQLNDLYQQELDNIVDDFESMANYAEAVKSASEATVDLYTAQGRTVNSNEAKTQIRSQMAQQSNITKTISNEIDVYRKKLAEAGATWGTNSVRYREAEAKLQEMNQALSESQTAYLELNKQLQQLDITKIEYVIDRFEALGNKLSSLVSLTEKRGGTIKESDYTTQVDNNNRLIGQYYDEMNKYINMIQSNNWELDSDNYKEAYENIVKCEDAIIKLLDSNEDLKQSIRSLRWKAFNDLQEKTTQTIDDLDYLRGLMTESQWFTEDNKFTERGYANIALLGQAILDTKKQVNDYKVALEKLEKEYKNGNITLDQYKEDTKQYLDTIKSGVTNIQEYKNALVEMYKTQLQKENEALQDLITKRKDALSAKKEYYDYDKTLSERNKDIQNLKAQIAALEGVRICPFYLIAGTPLESCKLQRMNEINQNVNVLKIV